MLRGEFHFSEFHKRDCVVKLRVLAITRNLYNDDQYQENKADCHINQTIQITDPVCLLLSEVKSCIVEI